MQKRPKGSHPLHRFEKGKKKQKMAKGSNVTSSEKSFEKNKGKR